MKQQNSSVLKLDENRRLIGNYPKILDLRKFDFDIEIIGHSYEEFVQAKKDGRLLQANICVSRSETVEVVYFPYNMIGIDYAIIENLPNLTELIVCCEEPSPILAKPISEELKWLICVNLPKLKRISITGGIKWLQIENAPLLESIDVSKCKSLDHLAVEGVRSLKNINIKNCRKLRAIVGLNQQEQQSLGVVKQIDAIQKKSKCNGLIYKDMTFTDIDAVQNIINEGVKLAKRKDVFDGDDDFGGYCYGKENDQDFKPFSFRLLHPLAQVFTGGTGEIYAYEALAHDDDGIVSSTGNSSQENCLEYALSALDLHRKKISSTKKILALLKNLLDEDIAKTSLEEKQETKKAARQAKVNPPLTVKKCALPEYRTGIISKRQPPQTLMKVSPVLGAIIGDEPRDHSQACASVFFYISKFDLVDPSNKLLFNADEKLFNLFEGKLQVGSWELIKLISKNLSDLPK